MWYQENQEPVHHYSVVIVGHNPVIFFLEHHGRLTGRLFLVICLAFSLGEVHTLALPVSESAGTVAEAPGPSGTLDPLGGVRDVRGAGGPCEQYVGLRVHVIREQLHAPEHDLVDV